MSEYKLAFFSYVPILQYDPMDAPEDSQTALGVL